MDIIMCIECEYCQFEEYNQCWMCNNFTIFVEPEDYCSWAIRREK